MKECELEIGGQKIDKHYGHWHSVYSQLTQFNQSGSKHILYNYMTGNGPSTSMSVRSPHRWSTRMDLLAVRDGLIEQVQIQILDSFLFSSFVVIQSKN